MKKNIVNLILLTAILIAIVTRFYKLGEAPQGLYLDEAGQGYSAFSILKTGKDEFGKPFPIVFRSFNDFKTPVYIYLIVPLIPIFDLTKFTVRFPSFFFSILTIPLIYLLISQLIKPKDHSENKSSQAHLIKRSQSIALLTSFLLAISPWHTLFGRTNFECNVALFFMLAGTYTFYLSHKKPKLLLISAILFAIAIPAYHAQRVVTPLLIFFLFIKHRKTLLSSSHIKYLFLGSIIGFLMLVPTLSVMKTPGFLARATLNIFSHERQMPAGYLADYNGPLGWLVNSSVFLSSRELLALYMSYFSPRNMFILGDYGQRSSFPEIATFFIWQFPFYILGIYLVFQKKELKEFRYFTLLLLLISPIPAAVTRDPYSSIRALQMVIPQSMLIALGISEFYQFLMTKFKTTNQKLFLNVTLLSSTILIFVYTIGRLYSSIIILNEYYRATEWNYGYEEIANTIKTLDTNLPIVFDNTRSEPYSQLLFFLKYDPEKYQQENFEVPISEYYTNMQRNTTKKIGNITTRPISWEVDTKSEKYLIGDSLAISDEQIKNNNLTLIKKITYPDNSTAFVITKTNP